MNDSKNQRNRKGTPVTEEMIPVVVGNEEYRTVRVYVDGSPAECFLHDRVFYSTKVVMLFEEEHPRWGACFTTKYFVFDEPGRMSWGHNGESMSVEIAG